MPSVDGEIRTQKRVIDWLVDDLRYIYLGNLEDQDNKSIKEDLLRKNLEKRGYQDSEISAAISKLQSVAGNQVNSLYDANKEFYLLLRYGTDVRSDNNHRLSVHFIDWDNPKANDFYVAEEVSVLREDGRTRKRPDLVIYVNGIALGMFELKRSSVSLGEGIRQLLQNQRKENIQTFFNTVQILFAGNESEGLRYGVIETPQKYYLQWKEDVKATNSLSTTVKEFIGDSANKLRNAIVSLCQKERFLSLIHDFLIFDAGVKKIARHNQYFAVIASRNRILEGEGGIVCHISKDLWRMRCACCGRVGP